MIAHLSQVILLLSSVTFAHESTRVIGHFGKRIIPIDFQFGDDVMIITSHKPVNGHDRFRETSNLHVFSRRLVAIRNALDKECYVQQFNATIDGMREKVKYALKNNGEFGEVKEERVMLGGFQPLGSDSVEVFLGSEIATFCLNHSVYLISGVNSLLLDPKEISHGRRGRRAVAVDSQGFSGGSSRLRAPVPGWCPCSYNNGGYDRRGSSGGGVSRGSSYLRSSLGRSKLSSNNGRLLNVRRQGYAQRQQYCPCRYWNGGYTSGWNGRWMSRCPQMCRCMDYDRDILIAC